MPRPASCFLSPPRRRGAEENQENQVHRASRAVSSSPNWSAEGAESAEKCRRHDATMPAHQVHIPSAPSALSGFDFDLFFFSAARRLGGEHVLTGLRRRLASG